MAESTLPLKSEGNRIFVEYPTQHGEIKEWTIVDLQGELEPPHNQTSIDGLNLGKLTVKEKGQANLSIGNLELEGKLIDLPKPYLVLQKNENADSMQTDTSNIHYDVAAIVKSRFVFKTRPKIIFAKDNPISPTKTSS
mmetsp:Transcript_8049/g.11071  ORF Transcript_8049/g.11071 Transcript_8049/m.11071 type:complete len:138 (+) Transcript_8049:89-502(+)